MPDENFRFIVRSYDEDEFNPLADRSVVAMRCQEIFAQANLRVGRDHNLAVIAYLGDRPDDDKVIGAVFSATWFDYDDGRSYTEDTQWITHSFSIVVQREYQGKGVGSALMDAALKNAPKESDFDAPVRISVLSINPITVPMLLKRGFEIVARLGKHTVSMEKKDADFSLKPTLGMIDSSRHE